MSKAITPQHLRAVNNQQNDRHGLLLRAEYCDFMARTAKTEHERKMWNLSGSRRREEAANAT
jgi:hypothetical protein